MSSEIVHRVLHGAAGLIDRWGHRTVEELRSLVGARSLSSTVDQAVGAYLSQLRHLRAVDE